MDRKGLLSKILDGLFHAVTGTSSGAQTSADQGVVHTFSAPQPIGSYSQGIQRENLVFCSGQIGLDPFSAELVSGGIKTETEQALRNIEAVLAEAGLSLENVTQSTVYLVSMEDYAHFDEVYASFFLQNPPSRTVVQVSALPRAAQVEITCVAIDAKEPN